MKFEARNFETGEIEVIEIPDSPRENFNHRPDAHPPTVLDQEDLTTLYVNATEGPRPVTFYRPVAAPEPTNKVGWMAVAILLCLLGVLAVSGLATWIVGLR